MARTPSSSSFRARTEDLRREIERSTGLVAGWGGLEALTRPMRFRVLVWSVLIWTAFVIIVGGVAIWSREQPRIVPGRIMTATRIAPVRFTFADPVATEQARALARATQAPRVYDAIPGVLSELRDSLEKLPLIAEDATDADSVEPGLRQQFNLTDATLTALRREIGDSEISASWRDRVGALMGALARHPLLSREAAQLESQALNKDMELHQEDGAPALVPSAGVINAEGQDAPEHLHRLAAEAGFEGPVLDAVVARLTHGGAKPTYAFNADATAAAQTRAAAAVPDQVVTYPEHEVIYRRGDVLTPAQFTAARRSFEARRDTLALEKLWGHRLAVVGIVAAIALATFGYILLFMAQIRRNPLRMGAIAGLFGGTAIVAAVATALEPSWIGLTALAPSLFCAVVLCIAYSQRAAIAFGALHALLVCAMLDLPVTMLAVLLLGIGAAAWRLREIRDRDTLIRAGVFVAAVFAGGTMLANLVELPPGRASVWQAAKDAGWAAFGGLLVAGLTLFILPSMEKLFSITTGLTLIELRDPKQPLLRQLQQRAPGTYNHSLTLGTLAEAAADAIGADGLLAYVGALYHDIGKMNKPEYFVENQTPGINRHDKLTPAMSLLIILGHVKDGLELAREFNLPRPLWHFIESHHGTTLVEYFFHRAAKLAERQAGDDEPEAPSELEYRYPGPRPRSREAAIVMICDAVEGATRAMGDPTPSRIDALVRSLATKRLLDGQFDECDLTLRELNLIVESVSRTLAGIYHGRIAYPGDAEPPRPETGANGRPHSHTRIVAAAK